MKIQIRDFKAKNHLVIRAEMSPEDLDLDIGVMHFAEPLQLTADAWKAENDLTVEVHVESPCRYTCSLCLEEFNNLFEKDFTLHYDIKGLDYVNIDPDVRDEIISEHPIRILCRPNCRGLCATCGANLNTESCDCKADS